MLLFRGRAAFGNEIARMISLAFDNEVVLTDDFASSLRRLMSPLPQNKTIVYFGFPEGIGQLVPPLSQKQTEVNCIYNYLPRRMPLLPFRWKDAPGLLLGTRWGGQFLNYEFRINRPYSLADGTWCLQRDLVIGEQRCCCLEDVPRSVTSRSTMRSY